MTLNIKNDKTSSAAITLNSSVNSASVIERYSKKFGDQNLADLFSELLLESKNIERGDLSEVENMLINQAKALEAIFSRMARVAIDAALNKHLELYLRMALKAQAQCTRTLATLHQIKNPSNVSFVKQANIGNNVQVNNAAVPMDSPQKNKNSTTELLGETDEKRMVGREKSEAVKANTALDAMETVHRA